MKGSTMALIGLILIVTILLALFVAAAIGSQWFTLPFADWFNHWGIAYPTGIKISPDKIIVG